MEIVQVKISKLKFAGYNPRRMSSDMMAALVNSIRKFGCLQPIVVNKKDNTVIGGHQRIKACQQLGMEEIPVIYTRTRLQEKDEKTLNIGFNKTTGYFVDEELVPLLEELKMEDENNLALTGFTPIELEELTDKPKAITALKYRMVWKNLDELLSDKKEIQEKYKDIKQIFVSFSGGKDSTACLILLREYFPKKPIKALYIDPGIEFPGMTVHVKLAAEALKCEFVLLKPVMDFWLHTLKRGWPSGIQSWCREGLIHKPHDDFVKQFKVEDVLICDGSRGDQAMRFSKKSRFSPLHAIKKYQAFHPIFDLKKEEEEKLLVDAKVPLWEGYERGFVRSACWCCPMQCSTQAYALQQNYPGLANFIRYWEKKISQKFNYNADKDFDSLVSYGEKLSKRKKP